MVVAAVAGATARARATATATATDRRTQHSSDKQKATHRAAEPSFDTRGACKRRTQLPEATRSRRGHTTTTNTDTLWLQRLAYTRQHVSTSARVHTHPIAQSPYKSFYVVPRDGIRSCKGKNGRTVLSLSLVCSFRLQDTRLGQPSPAMTGNGAITTNFAPIDLKPRIWTFQMA